jgi:hypothetical protein
MAQVAFLYRNDIAKDFVWPITGVDADDVDRARLMVTPADPTTGKPGDETTSIEWTSVTITDGSSAGLTLTHRLVADDLPTAGIYAARAYFYDVVGDEIASTDVHTIQVNPSVVGRPTTP